MMSRFLPKSTPETSPVMTSIIYWYLPRISRMKLPDMPGRIIAQMAIAPLMKMNHSASGVLVGESVQMTTPSTTCLYESFTAPHGNKTYSLATVR